MRARKTAYMAKGWRVGSKDDGMPGGGQLNTDELERQLYWAGHGYGRSRPSCTAQGNQRSSSANLMHLYNLFCDPSFLLGE